ncbi:MAG: formylmethanofuran dehydrogenase subunit C [Methanosphaera sp.]|nr:formylmethanofuran dehydrogenase subunit C [Methanosphaera sp.]
MKTITIKTKKLTQIPIEFDNILPEELYDKPKDQIDNTIIYHGNKEEVLSTYYDVSVSGIASSPDKCLIHLIGDYSHVKYIGSHLSCGLIIVDSDVDLHVGSEMSGGHIIVNGNAESYAGREMSGGLLEIIGNTKELCGCAYMGQWQGMTGGKIIIYGNAGKQLGESMAGGEIIVKGDCDYLPGIHMSNGYIQIDGDVTQWPAGQMKNGELVINGHIEQTLQGFRKIEAVINPYIHGEYHIGRYNHYIGDESARGKGSVWIKE